ncbi:hypothetical protein OQJ46_03505 [Microbulbifer thermotolerans]|uniref:Uncharacterized protein n=1 Tax=Microbulbifer thermotolerans TaxID=252514 RepID=A0AB35I2W5_MICTH|nr:hypothetical protein [Microbulbifer thermotolerans]MCX2781083.1 hypothetical protein [Microbulbifer thermotolerans]MCX2782055.1 hypothetical protein [Microbulbifer thermotolerans]MCX2796257.1 hypothetical protein [Microbulbifer thermotolerans]MCX2803331.1 hypothetical protein [Microbulbifer thermotolerans]MCX2806400.1 hypothetical protein [Microbulbifer thermotolerans]
MKNWWESCRIFSPLNSWTPTKRYSIGLYGQYLYDYIEISDDSEVNQPRKFSTSEFALIRKNKNKEILRVNIGYEVIEEIIIEDPKIEKLHDLGVNLADGEVIKKIAFDKILEVVV